MRRAGTILLAMLSLSLAFAIWLELRPDKTGPMTANTQPRPARAADRKTMSASAAQDQAWLETILARPLFAASRRPPVQAAVARAATSAPLLPRLAGILIDGKRRSVIFAPGGDQKPVTVAEGGMIDGFHIESIDSGTVTVTGQGKREILRPSFNPQQAPVKPLNPPPPAPARPGGFNGPPGLDAMPKLIVPPPRPTQVGLPGLPGVPGLPTLGGLTGIPGLPTPTQPAR